MLDKRRMRAAPVVLGPLVVCAACAGALVAGAGFLTLDLPGGLPLGNGIAALALVSAAGVAVGVGRPGTALRRYGWVALGVAVLWLPASVALLGNLRLNGTPGASSGLWLGFTATAALLALSALVWAGGAALRRVWRARRATPRPA